MTEIFAHASPFLLDGAMGTYYLSRKDSTQKEAELASLYQPEAILEIHKEYLQAGCDAISTNTFSVSRKIAHGQEETAAAIQQASIQLAKKAIEETERKDALIFGEMGPVPEEADAFSIYCQQARRYLDAGIDHLLIETLSSPKGLAEFSGWLQETAPHSSLILSFAVGADGISSQGYSYRQLLDFAFSLPKISAAGLNCVSGPLHLYNLVKSLPKEYSPLLVMPNAGYPQVQGRNSTYKGSPEYFAYKMADLHQAGAVLLGGCCGTTPAHISKMKQVLAVFHPVKKKEVPAEENRLIRPRSHFKDKMAQKRKPVAVELDPPASDIIAPFMEKVSALKAAGADMITIADCPIGRVRADSSLLACKVQRELGIEVLPHMTCRDRNLNAARALLLGLSMEGVHNLLIVTGDPIPSEAREEVKSVYTFNSRGMAKYIASLPGSFLSVPFHLYGALDINARNFSVQLALAKEKEANGITCFLTQPLLSAQALENLKLARTTLSGAILAGILPIVSYKNALFLNNEISGMQIDDAILEAYKGKERQDAEKLAIEISLEAVKAAAQYCDGYYIMTPFQRSGLVCRLLEEMKNAGCI